MPDNLAWAGAVSAGILFYRALRAWTAVKNGRKANYGDGIASPDRTGAEVTVVRNANGIELYVRCWGIELPSSRGLIFLVHGATLHSAYFETFAKQLVRNGFVVYTYDFQGHGLSGCAHGVRMDFPSFSDIVRDTQDVANFVRKKHPAERFFVFAESMGALVVLRWAIADTKMLDAQALILSGSLVTLTKEVIPPRLIQPFMELISTCVPPVRVPNDQFDATFDDAFGDKRYPEAARNDPIVLYQPPTLRYVMQVVLSTREVAGKLGSIRAPLLLLHGKEDGRCGWENSQKLYDKTSSTIKKLKVYEGMTHQLLQESPHYQKMVFDDILQWLDTWA